MKRFPGLVPAVLAAGLAALAGAPAPPRLAVRVEPSGCKPSPPFAFDVRAIATGPASARVEATVTPAFDAAGIVVGWTGAEGAALAAPKSSGPARAGEPSTWCGEVRLGPGEAGVRVLVQARVTLALPGPEGRTEAVSALREVEVGAPPDRIPGRLVRAGGVETVEIPSVRLR